MNTDNIVIELKCHILDILARKKEQGFDEVAVLDLLDELGMDAESNITGMDPGDTITLTSKALDNLEATKAQIRRGASSIH